jgi:AcrR family transcriptional regulator
VYRYFPSSEALLIFCTMRSANGFLDQFADHISGLTEPTTAIVEGVAFAAETLAGDRQIEHLLSRRTQGGSTVTLTSDTAMAFGRSMLHRLDVDWEKHGFDEAALDELAEIGLRTLHSILIDPGAAAPRWHRATQVRRPVARARDCVSAIGSSDGSSAAADTGADAANQEFDIGVIPKNGRS